MKSLRNSIMKKPAQKALIILLSAVMVLTASGCRKNAKPSDASGASSLPQISSPQPSSSSEAEPAAAELGLSVTSPSKTNVTVTSPLFTFTGSCDPSFPLLFNGEALATDAQGNFSKTVELTVGANSFTLEHKDKKTVYTVNYRYAVMKACNPAKGAKYDSGASFAATVNARAGAECYAEFNGTTVKLERPVGQDELNNPISPEEFRDFVGFFTLPSGNKSDLNLGKISFKATYNGITDTMKSGNITCRKTVVPVIAEVTAFAAETFNGNSADNWTRPTNNYLPAGTVDYVNGSYSAKDGKYTNNFLILRCGRRIYSDMPITPGTSRVQVAKTYEGTLPDHNEITAEGVSSDARRTYITLSTMWKAPFFLDYKPQGYTNAAQQDYTVNAVTFSYIDISFCYATVFSGSISFENNPVFSSAQIIPGNGSTTLRLHLKRAGGFYGWDCYYNNAGKLVFEFLHPPVGIADAARAYGADLSGLRIVVDAGHGGFDGGAGGPGMKESERNLNLANKVKAELEKTGATVLMTRTNDSALQSPARVASYRAMKADLLISVHHDSATTNRANGFGSYYTTPFSQPLANKVYNRVLNTGIYSAGNRNKLAWHHFYMTRMTFCPAVLTENGCMGGSIDAANIKNEDINTAKAQAIVQGVVDYLLEAK